MSYWLLAEHADHVVRAAEAAEGMNAERDTVVLAAVTLGVWILSLFVLYLLVKYAVLDALRINRWEGERDRGR